MAKEEPVGGGEGEGVGLSVGGGFAASAIRSNPAMIVEVANNGFMPQNRYESHRVPYRKSNAVVTFAAPPRPQ